MPKLLQINSTAAIGSTGRIADQLGEMVISKGWESYIAYGRSAGNSNSKLIKIGSKLSILFHYFISRVFDLHGFGSWLATKRFINKIKTINPDIIHLHNIHGYYINFSLLFQFISKYEIPVIWTLHDFWTITGHCTAPVLFNCEKWKTGCYNCPCKTEYPLSFIDNSKSNWRRKRHVFNKSKRTTLVSVSNWLGNFIQYSYFTNVGNRVITNGIDFSGFSLDINYQFLKTNNIENKFKLISVASGWNETNGFSQFIDFSNKLPENVILILVGVTETQKKLLPANMVGISLIHSISELSSIYASADLFVNICKSHSFGLVNIESMACGTPVVVLRNTAGEEIITPETGFVIDNIEEILPIIEVIKSNGKNHYKEKCRQRAKLFDIHQKHIEYYDLYRSIINNVS